MRLIRVLRLRDVEVWRNHQRSKKLYLILIDMKRPSSIEDYPYLKGVEKDDEFGRDNYFKVITLSSLPLENDTIEELTSHIDDLIGHVDQGYCDWNMEERLCDEENLQADLNEIIEYFTGNKINWDTINKNLYQEISEKEYWSQKFKQREDKLMEPELFLKNNIQFLRSGTVLDIACGDGRNAIYLAKRGFEVTGVDFSDEAIKRLSKFSDEHSVMISKKLLDLNNLNEIKSLGKFSNIIISHYKPTMELFHTLPNLLVKDGVLILCTFNHRQHEERGFPMKYCLAKDELLNVCDELSLIKHEVIYEERGHLDGYIFKRK